MSGITTPLELLRNEAWWRDQYYGIKDRGYALRPRYHPSFESSWKYMEDDSLSVEDVQPSILRTAMDATRHHDKKRVMLKKITSDEGSHELEITKLLSSFDIPQDPCDHRVPLLDIIEIPQNGQKLRLVVMPFLRPFNDPPFETFGEFVAFFIQICEGLQFMHMKNIAHRDCTADNVMFDPSKMYPQELHPTRMHRNEDIRSGAKRYTRTQRPPRYYLINFGLSRQYESRNSLDIPLRGSAPEQQNTARCNPFYTDIYYLGNLVRQEFIQKYNGFKFMHELVNEMTHDIPDQRPSIEGVIERLLSIRKSLNVFKLRTPLISKQKSTIFSPLKQAARAGTRSLLSHKAAIPEP